jgi:hypothetical protein
LREITPKLPVDVRRLVELGSLHDARVIGLWQAQLRLTVVLQREGETSRLCILTYALVDPLSVDARALPERYRSERTMWLYDEIGVDRETLFDAAAGVQYRTGSPETGNGGQPPGAPVFTHEILLSNGCELRLRFHRFRIERPTVLFPAVPQPPSGTQEPSRDTYRKIHRDL